MMTEVVVTCAECDRDYHRIVNHGQCPECGSTEVADD
jgi:Zn finger protein HypA/HybF involved in hydrogenase expression